MLYSSDTLDLSFSNQDECLDFDKVEFLDFQGETGSPVVSNGILYAIVSVDTCNGSSDRRYTNVFHHIDWIKRIIAA